MAKKKLVELEELVEKEVLEAEVEFEVKKLDRLDLDFGREDLNKLRDKVNELVDAANL